MWTRLRLLKGVTVELGVRTYSEDIDGGITKYDNSPKSSDAAFLQSGSTSACAGFNHRSPTPPIWSRYWQAPMARQ